MVCTEAEGNGFDSGLDSGFKSILRSNAGRGGIVLARSNKASATSTSSETVGVDDTFSSFGTLGFDPLGFCIMREQTSIANQSPNYYYSPARFAVAMEAQEMCD